MGSTATAVRRLALACAATALAAAVATVAGAANSKTFTDPAGDSETSPDVTSVAVKNDDEGNVTVRVAIPNRESFRADDFVGIYVNTDQNASTGCANTDGGDYAFVFLGKAATLSNFFVLLHCKGKDFDPETLQGSFAGSIDRAGHALEFSVNRRDIGSPSKLGFFVIASSSASKKADYAPDDFSSWAYDVIAPKPPTFSDAFAKKGQQKVHTVPLPSATKSVQVVVRWDDPRDTFTVTDVQIPGEPNARIARIRKPDKLCSITGCRQRKGTSLLVDVTGLSGRISRIDSAGPSSAAARRVRFAVRGTSVSHTTHVRTEVVRRHGGRKGKRLASGSVSLAGLLPLRALPF